MNGSFYEQLGSVAGVFEQWGACERTVVACVLARRVPWPGLKLLQRSVEAALAHHNTLEDELLEREANDEMYLASLLSLRTDDDDDDGDKRLHKLLTLVPLLRADNERVKEAYVRGAGALLQRCVDAPRRTAAAPALARHLLSYLLVHPATTPADHRTLTQWLRYLENHMSGNRNTETVWQQRIDPCLLPDDNIWGASNQFRRTIGKNVEFRGAGAGDGAEALAAELLQRSFSSNGRDVDSEPPAARRSNSLTPPGAADERDEAPPAPKPRSFSLSSEHSLAALRPLAGLALAGAGSETRLDHLRAHASPHPGMAAVGPWLKSLRLHKYVWLFTNISYDGMMAMDEKYLEKLGVTKGARHKILVSIKKLGERAGAVELAEAELARAGGAPAVGRALERLRAVLLSPMPVTSPLPAHVVRVLQLASKCVNVPGGAAPGAEEPDHDAPDPLSLHCWLVEKALHHEAFNRPELIEALKRLRHRLPPRQFFHHVGDLPLHRRCPKPRWRVPGAGGAGGAGGARRWSGGAVGVGSVGGGAGPPPDEYSSLAALCLQMTEQAIN